MSPLPSTSSHAPRSGARAWGRACGWIAALSIAACGGAWAAEAPPATARAEQGGLALQLSLQPAGKEPGRYLARLSFSDAGSGAPLPGLQPAAWMQQLRSPAELELPCEDRARRFVAGSLGSRADVDLNTYHLVSLNQDRTLHFINPLVRIRNSRMEATVQLSGDGFDWVHDADTHQLAVTLRDAGRLAVVDTLTQRLAGEMDLGPGSRPTRVALDPGGRRAWVGLDGAGALAVVDLAKRRELGRVPLGSARNTGAITLAAVPGRPWLVAATAQPPAAVLIDTDKARAIGRLSLPAGPVAVAWSPAAERVLVLSGQTGVLSQIAVSPTGLQLDGQVVLEPGALALAVVGEGRHVLVSNVQRHEISLIDLARGVRTDRAKVPDWPDHIITTRDFAYVRSQASNNVTLFALDAARGGRLQALAVPLGRASASEMPKAINVAPLMVPAPDGHGIWAAVAADAQIYRYNEGLMVPSGSLDNYRRNPRALMVIDESLREVAPGRFEGPVRVPRSGRYDVVVLNSSPSFTGCLGVTLQGPPESTEPDAPAPPRLVRWSQDGREVRFAVQLEQPPADLARDPIAAQAPDVQALLVGPHGSWQKRTRMMPASRWHWEAQLQLPQGVNASDAQLLLQSQRLGWAFASTRLGTLGTNGATPALEVKRHEAR